jgi:thioredoxin 2
MYATIPCPGCGTLNRIDLGRLAAGPRCGQCKQALHLDHPVPVDARTLDRVLAGTDAPVLVDFYADWCGPCRMVAPIVEQVARARAGRALVLKVDTDQSPSLMERFGIRGIPTLIAFRGARETGRQVGLAQRAQLEALVA